MNGFVKLRATLKLSTLFIHHVGSIVYMAIRIIKLTWHIYVKIWLNDAKILTMFLSYMFEEKYFLGQF
jgi:hypothetical protein